MLRVGLDVGRIVLEALEELVLFRTKDRGGAPLSHEYSLWHHNHQQVLSHILEDMERRSNATVTPDAGMRNAADSTQQELMREMEEELEELVGLQEGLDPGHDAARTEDDEEDVASEGNSKQAFGSGDDDNCSAWWRRLRKLLYTGEVREEHITVALGSLKENLIDRNIAFDVATEISEFPRLRSTSLSTSDELSSPATAVKHCLLGKTFSRFGGIRAAVTSAAAARICEIMQPDLNTSHPAFAAARASTPQAVLDEIAACRASFPGASHLR